MRGVQQSGRSAQPAASAGGNFIAFWFHTMQQHTTAQHHSGYSLLYAQWNGVVYERHWPWLVENERLKIRLREHYFCGWLAFESWMASSTALVLNIT